MHTFPAYLFVNPEVIFSVCVCLVCDFLVFQNGQSNNADHTILVIGLSCAKVSMY